MYAEPRISFQVFSSFRIVFMIILCLLILLMGTNNVFQIYKKIIKLTGETSLDNALSESNAVFLAKVKELLNITKDRLKKKPHHPLHLQLKEEMLELQIDIDFNGTVNSRKYLFRIIFG